MIPVPERVTAGNGVWYVWMCEPPAPGFKRWLILRVLPHG